MIEGTARFVRELKADDAATVTQENCEQSNSFLCLGLRSELDTLSAEMLAHALTAAGHTTCAMPFEGWGKPLAKNLDWVETVQRIYLCSLSAAPQTQARIMSRRLRRHWPSAEIVLVGWCAANSLDTAENLNEIGVNQVVFRFDAVLESVASRAQANQEENRGPAAPELRFSGATNTV